MGAGPGWGRTALAAGYAEERGGAWLRLGDEHAAADRLIEDLATALDDPSATPVDAADDPIGAVLAACARAPVELLVLDDAHRTSGPGEQVLRRVIAARPEEVQLLVTSRDVTPLVSVTDLASGRVLRLDATHLALDVAAVRELLELELGTGDDVLAARIVDGTGGWPVAVRLVIDALFDAPVDERLDRARTAMGAAGPVSAYLRDQVLPVLPPRVRDAVTQLALLGDRDAAGFAAATGRAEPEAQEVLDDLVARGLARRPSLRGGTARVVTIPVVASTVLERDLPTRGPGDRLVDDLVAGLQAVGELASAAEVLHRCGRLGALQELLERHGSTLLHAGELTVLRAVTGAVGLGASREVALLRAHACAYLGDWASAETALARCLVGPEDRGEVGPEGPLDAEVALAAGIVRHLRGDLAGALAAYARARSPQGPIAVELVGWGSTARWLRGDIEGARALADEARAGATALGDPRLLALAHTATALVAASDGDRAANQRHYDLALTAARAAGDALQQARILTNRGSLHLEEGRFEEARRETEAAIDLAESQGSVQIGAIARCNRAEILLRTGSLDEAIADAQLARDRFASIGSRHESYAHHLLGDARRERGELVLARRAYERSLQLSGPTGDRQGNVPALIGLARTLITSDLDAAEVAADRGRALDDGLNRPAVLLVQGWIALARGDTELVRARVAEAEAEAVRRGDRTGLAEAATLGALVASDPVAALRDAAAQWWDLDVRIAATRVELGLARRSTRPADRARAAELERQLRSWGCATERGAFAHAAVLGAGDGPRTVVRVLGEFAVERDGQPVPPSAWGSRKARDLLRILATRPARGATREELAHLLWPDEPYEVVANRLSVALSVVRGVLTPDDAKGEVAPLVADGTSVRLDPVHVELDLERFERLAEEGLEAARRAGRVDAAVEALEAAERAYGGDLLEHDVDADGVVERREHLRSTYVAVARTLARLLVSTDPERSVRLLLRVLDRDPHDEPAHLAVCAALVRARRHGEARRRHALYVRRMDELGLPAVPLDEVLARAGRPRRETA